MEGPLRWQAPASRTWRALELRSAACTQAFRRVDGTIWLIVLVAVAAISGALFLT